MSVSGKPFNASKKKKKKSCPIVSSQVKRMLSAWTAVEKGKSWSFLIFLSFPPLEHRALYSGGEREKIVRIMYV